MRKMSLFIFFIVGLNFFVSLATTENRDLVPLEAPSNLTLLHVAGTQAKIAWDPVASQSLRGHFRGYLIRIWNHSGSQVYAIPSNTTIMNVDFFPFSKNFITVSARNDRYVGPPSDAIAFDAPQLEPNYPFIFKSYQLGVSSALLRWNKPTQPNGILLGYRIYLSEMDVLGKIQEKILEINDPDQFQSKIINLKLNSNYKIGLTSFNCKGESQKNSIDFELKPHESFEPFPPDFILIMGYKHRLNETIKCEKHIIESSTPMSATSTNKNKIDYDYYDYVSTKNETEEGKDKKSDISSTSAPPCLVVLKVIWIPDIENNPGDYFYVKYRIKGEEDFQITPPEMEKDSLLISNFNACRSYEIILTTVDGNFSTDSKLKTTPTTIFEIEP